MEAKHRKLRMDDTPRIAAITLAEGHPGALNVLLRIVDASEGIDPDNLLGGLGVMLDLETLEVYGARIWMLYKDVCGEDLVKTLAVFARLATRANRSGNPEPCH